MFWGSSMNKNNILFLAFFIKLHFSMIMVLKGKLLKWWSGTSPYLEDVVHPSEVPDGDHDGLGHLH